MILYIIFLAVTLSLPQQAEPCGLSTHIEIAHRALEFFSPNGRQVNYRELLKKHPDAYQAGSVYPDAFYQGLCAQGKYHYVSEDSHWTPFLKASIDYLRITYPHPWGEGAEKLVAFLFGIASHMVADVTWHSLHIDQGFLRAMAATDFHGSYSDAHHTGDFGGDVLSQYELDFNYLESKWYIPVKDLFNIYQGYYQATVIEERTIIDCTYIMFLQLYGEYMAVSKLYATYVKKSPFMVERFHEYFLGGVEDMAFWSTNIFQLTSYMLDNGTSDCYLPENPVFLRCYVQRKDHKVSRKLQLEKTETYKDLNSSAVSLPGADVVSTESGVYFQINQWAEHSMQILSRATQAMTGASMFNFQRSSRNPPPSATYFITSPYSRLGWTLTTADLNLDGWDDLVIGAPGFSSLGNLHVGRVYIVYGNDSGLPSADLDLNKEADVLLTGSETSGRFGSSVAVLDFNADGQPDLAVGAPSIEAEKLAYTGSVYIFFGTKEYGLPSQPDVTIKCKHTYCNLGWTLLAADVNQDQRDDLIIGSPYAPGGGKQRGMVAAFYSHSKWSGKDRLFAEKAEWIVVGEHDYAWFGFSLRSHKSQTKTLLVIGSPTWSFCQSYECEDLQSVGKAYGFYPPHKHPSFVIEGSDDQSKMGSSFSSGTIEVNGERKEVLFIGSPTQNVVSRALFFSSVLYQAGISSVYELKNEGGPSLLGTLKGNGELSRYGMRLHLNDLDGDGLDEIIVTSPMRTYELVTMLPGSQAGRVYIYNGNATSTGLIKGRCKAWHSPCPEDWAQYILISPDEKSRFGSAVATVKSGQRKQIVVSAVRSSVKARLAGILYLYNLK